MSHGYYPEGEGPGTDDLASWEHPPACACAECWYQREQMFQDLREEQEAADPSNSRPPPCIIRKEEPQ